MEKVLSASNEVKQCYRDETYLLSEIWPEKTKKADNTVLLNKFLEIRFGIAKNIEILSYYSVISLDIFKQLKKNSEYENSLVEDKISEIELSNLINFARLSLLSQATKYFQKSFILESFR
jgi:hypothetical protein